MPIFSDDAINAFQTAVMSNPANIEIYNDIGKVGGYGSQADNPIDKLMEHSKVFRKKHILLKMAV